MVARAALTVAACPPYTDAVRLVVVMSMLASMIGPRVGGAEHRIEYRYVVLGFATTAKGQPLPSQPVTLVRDKTGLAYRGETDPVGFYVIVTRLGDENAGERLTLTVGAAVARLTARFDAHNHRDERGTRVDIVAGRAVERAAWFPSTLKRYLGTK